jgi:hypothetical protein
VRHLSMGQLVVQALELRGEGVAQRWPASEVRGGGGKWGMASVERTCRGGQPGI